jgi:ATP-dependent DNA ligase
VRSRRGWNMAALLPELEQALPSNVQLDGQLDALDEFGYLDFRLLGQRMLQRRGGISVTYMVFDLLARDGDPRRAARKRHAVTPPSAGTCTSSTCRTSRHS